MPKYDLDVNIPLNMKAALRNGLLSSTLPNPPFSCPTGNCTWDAFATLAVGTQFEDLTSEVHIECFNADNCTFTVLDDAALAYVASDTIPWTVLTMSSAIPTQMEGGPTAVRNFVNNTASFALVQWIKSTNSSTVELKPKSAFEAVRCDFYLSVKEVVPEVVNGVYSEQILQEVTRPEAAPGLSYSMDYFPFHFFLSPYETNGARIDSVEFRLNGSAPSNIGKTYTFKLNGQGFRALSSQLVADTDFMTGEVSRGTGGGQPVGPSNLIMLWQADNTTEAMYNLADAITTQMRANTTMVLQQRQKNESVIAPEDGISGYVWVQQQTVVVRWNWLIMPVVLLVLAAVFFLVAYMNTRRRRMGLWLSSPLTLFFHAQPVDQSGRKTVVPKVSHLDTADAMRRAASRLTAKVSLQHRDTLEVYFEVKDNGFSEQDINLIARDSLEEESS